MILQAQARQAIIDQWSRYIVENKIDRPATTRDALEFYRGLQKSHSRLLRFRSSGDKYQTIKNWLLHEGLVTEPHNLP